MASGDSANAGSEAVLASGVAGITGCAGAALVAVVHGTNAGTMQDAFPIDHVRELAARER